MADSWLSKPCRVQQQPSAGHCLRHIDQARIQDFGAVILDQPLSQVRWRLLPGQHGVRRTGAERGELRHSPATEGPAKAGIPGGRGQIPVRKENQVVALVEIGIAAVRAAVILARKCGARIRLTAVETHEAEVEEVAGQCVTLVVD